MRLYRLKDLIGNKTTVSLLQRSLHNKTLKNFIILSGVMGTGKSTSAETIGLYLTCENPKDSDPCLECSSCKTNIRALQSTGVSRNLVKKNIGLLNDRKGVTDLIKEIFVLQGSPTENNVYILEEAHVLSHADQTPLLEEIDRLDDRTFIIICVTRVHKLLPELRSRAIIYNFNRLTRAESKMLFDRTVNRLGIKKIDREVENMIIRYSRGIPRDLVNLIDFINKNSPTKEEVMNFLGFISNDTFLELFRSMFGSLRDVSIVTEDLISSQSLDTVVVRLKEFVVNCMFALGGNISEEFTRAEMNEIKTIFTEDTLYRVSSITERLSPTECTEADFKLAIIKIRQLFNNKALKDILIENRERATIQEHEADTIYIEKKEFRDKKSFAALKRLEVPKHMKSFGEGGTNES